MLRRLGGVTRIVVADDQHNARAALCSALDGHAQLAVVGEASNGHEALALCRDLQPDLLLVDVRMPDIDGLAITRTIKRERPAMSVIVVTLDGGASSVVAAVRSGANGFIQKGMPQRQFLSAIRQTLHGDSPIHPSMASVLVEFLCPNGGRSVPTLVEPLTDTECEIVRLRADGRSHQMIARRLQVTSKEVTAHLERVMLKLGAPTSGTPS
jgi:DNA-binding NarL/FixJ family response regulator